MYERGSVLVTGALGGLGTAIVARLLRDGAHVIATDRRHDDASTWRGQFSPQEQSRLRIETLDITKEAEIEALKETLLRENIAVAYLVNNAGVAGSGPPDKMSTKTFDIILKVNLFGTFYCTRAWCGEMRARGFGRIVNFASAYAYHPGPGEAPYAAAKAGIIGYTHSTARDLAPAGVTVNVIAPGLIWHDRLNGVLSESDAAEIRSATPMRRAGQPAEIAGVVAFLLSDDSSYITGQTLHVNGGFYMTG
ncbi:MAG: SDR family oxidoreductase [Gammaproteobacteria bacterium]|nr:SDR family oxidoreductase [Gammaproteobacteria bacterium]